jgi:hypothetical protein
MAQARGLYDDESVAAMGYTIEEYQQVMHLRDSVFQMYELAMSGANGLW